MNRYAKIIIIIMIAGVWIFLGIKNKPKAAYPAKQSVDLSKGFINRKMPVSETISIDQGILKSIELKTEFSLSGKIFMLKTDSQPGFDFAISIAYNKLADPVVFEHILNHGSLNKKFSENFSLSKSYFQRNMATCYLMPANTNLKNTIKSLKIGDTVTIEGHLVYLVTDQGIVSTSLDKNEFKCKYAYVTEISTDQYTYL